MKKPTNKRLIDIIVKEFKPFMEDSGVELIFDKVNNYVGAGDLACSGYFDDENRMIHVAIGTKEAKDWFSTFVHEYCHFLQWSSQSPEWIKSQESYNKNSDAFLDDWLSGAIESENIEGVLESIMELELDCEKRASEILQSYPDVIDSAEYIQKSNAYVAFYRQILLKRTWYNAEKAPYLNEEIYLKMPTVFLDTKSYWDDYMFSHINWDLCL